MPITRLAPILPVRDMSAAVEFYEKLGFELVKRVDAWNWAMLARGEARIMVDQSTNPHPGTRRTGVIYLYASDLIAFHREATARGLELPEPEPTFYGMIEIRIEDPDGNRLWIGEEPATVG
ncbi:MAG: VOC family protein [Planctomycetota bacterium]